MLGGRCWTGGPSQLLKKEEPDASWEMDNKELSGPQPLSALLLLLLRPQGLLLSPVLKKAPWEWGSNSRDPSTAEKSKVPEGPT